MAPIVAVAVVAVAAVAVAAHASTVIVLPLPQLRARADVVVHARVTAQHVDAAAGARPVTYTTLHVLDAEQGAVAGDDLVVYQPGVLDGVRVRWIAGAHVFHVGDDVVFIGQRLAHDGRSVVVAMAPGVGVFDVRHAGARVALLVEDGGIVDATTGAVVSGRTFASVRALYEATR